ASAGRCSRGSRVTLAFTDVAEAETADRAAGPHLDAAILGGLSRPSDWQGALRLASHAGCICATGFLVWQALPSWYLLVPATAVHGLTLVTLFAPMHECV